MDGRAQLQSLALAINGASDIESAWAGRGNAVDIRKQCGICGEDQPLRVPFLRHVCRSCAAIWVPGICGDCAHTSVTFTLDGQLSRFASCGCGGALRQVAYVPKPRVALDPEVEAARQVVIEQVKKRATWTSRTAMVLVAVIASVGAYQFVRSHHDGPPEAARQPTRPVLVGDDPTLSWQQRGARAAARLVSRGEAHDVFACASQLPAPPPPGSTEASREGAAAGSKEFLAACLAG